MAFRRGRHSRPGRARVPEAVPAWSDTARQGASGGPPATGSTRHLELGRLARGGLVNLVGVGGNAVFGFAFVVLVDRSLPADGAGALFEAIALFTICANAAELGADDGLLRLVPRYRVSLGSGSLVQLLLAGLVPAAAAACLLGAAVVVLAPVLAHVLVHGRSGSQGASDLRLLGPFLPLATASTVALAGTRGLGHMLPYAGIQNLAVPALRTLLVALVAALGLGASAEALAWSAPLAVGLLGAVAALAILGRPAATTGPEPPGPGRWSAVAGELWRFSAPRGLAGVFQIAVIQIDILLVGGIRSSADAAVYTVASRYLMVGTLALQAVGLTVGPQISRLLAQGERLAAQSVFQTATTWIVLLAWPIYLAMGLFSPLLMGAFGPTYARGATALSVLTGGMLVSMALGNNQTVLVMAGGSGWNLFITTLCLVTNLGLNLWLIPWIGIEGAALAWTAVIILANVLTVAVLVRVVHLLPIGPSYNLAIVGASACFGLVGLAARALLGSSALALGLTVVLGGTAYAVLVHRHRDTLDISSLARALRHRLGGGGSSALPPVGAERR